jgi:hypothetical protein
MNKIFKPSEQINQKILADIKARLNPSFQQIILKLFAIHLVVGFVTLSICPQMGVSTFHTEINLMDYFMYFGPTVCSLLCGMFFLFCSMLLGTFILSIDEDRLIKSKKYATTSILLLYSIGFLVIFSPNIFVEFSLIWLIGAFLGSILSIEIGALFKNWLKLA